MGLKRTVEWSLNGALALICGVLTIGCAGRGGPSDVCSGGACEAVPDCELGICDASDDPLRARSSSRHSMSAGTTRDSLSASCPFTQDEIPPIESLLDDSTIPEFKRARARQANYAEGHVFLQDHELHEHLLTVQGALFECLDLAACYDLETSGTGELDFQFELEPNGQVSGVSVSPSVEIDQPIVRACARRSVYESQFPSWDGSRMIVSYSVELSEGSI